MSENVLKVVPAPEAKVTPDAKSKTPRKSGRLARLGRKRLRMILLVGLPAIALLAGIGFYLSGGRYISTDNAYVGAQKVLITPDVSDKIIHVAVVEGQHVKPGDELFTLDPDPYRLALEQAQAKLAGARSNYDKLKTTLSSLTTLVELAKKNVEFKQRDVDRKLSLVKSQAGSQADVDTAGAALVTAQLQAQFATQQRDDTLNQLLGDPNLPLEKFPEYGQAKAALDQAQRDLDHTVVRAPIAGTATQVDNIQLGRFVTAGTPILSVIDDSAPWVDANPKETDITYLRVGQKADARRRHLPRPHLPGHGRLRSAPAPARSSRSCRRRTPAATGSRWCSACRCASPSTRTRTRRLLRSGMSVNVEIDTGHSRLAVPVGGGERTGKMTAAHFASMSPALRRMLVTVCAMTATIMQALDTTIANVALPYMQGSLSASLDQINWVLTSYIVAAAIMTAPIGWLADRFGRKKLFIICVAGFTVASLLCALAQNIEQMVLFRLLQGMAGAALVPLSQSVLLDAYTLAGARPGHGDLGHRRDARADHGPDARRLADRQLFLALGVPDQPADRHRHRDRHAAVHGRDPPARASALRLVRLSRARRRHRLAAIDARPRRAGRLVRLKRDLDRDDRLDRRLLLFLRPFADHAGAVRALRTVQGPQFRQRRRVHGGDRRGAVRHHGAGDAVHAEPARLSDPDRRSPARLARRRHAAHHDGGAAADADAGDALPDPDRAAAHRRHALCHDRVFARRHRSARS